MQEVRAGVDQAGVADEAVEQATIERPTKDDFAELLGAATVSGAREAAEHVQALPAPKNDAARAYGKGLIDIDQLEEISAS